MPINIQDYVLELGFDGSQVEKGLKSVRKMMQNLDKIQDVSAKKERARSKQKVDAISRENSRLVAQKQLRAQINRAEKAGISGLKRERGALGGANAAKIRNTALKLEKRVTEELRKQEKISSKIVAKEKQAVTEKKRRVSGGTFGSSRLVTSAQRQRSTFRAEDVIAKGKTISAKAPEEFQNRLKSAIRLAEMLKNKMAETSNPARLIQLNRRLQLVSRSMTTLGQSVARTNRELKKQSFVAKGAADSVRNLARSYVSVFAVLHGGQQFFQIGREFDSLKASALAAAGSVEQAGDNFKFIKGSARALGQPLRESIFGFNRIGIAARGAGFSTNTLNEIFLAASESSTAFSLDSQRTGNVFLAFSQIISKGKFSLEEVSRQLGENLPTALLALERATGKTRPELFKLIESGRLLSDEETVLNFAKQLRILAREGGALAAGMQKVRAEQGRFTLAFQERVDLAFQESADGFKAFFKSLTNFLVENTDGIKAFGKTLGVVFKTIAGIIRVLTPIFKFFGNVLSRIVEQFESAVKGGKALGRELTSIERGVQVFAGSIMLLGAAIEVVVAFIDKMIEKIAGKEGAKEALNGMAIVAGAVGAIFTFKLAAGIWRAVAALSKFIGLAKLFRIVASALGLGSMAESIGGKKPTPGSPGRRPIGGAKVPGKGLGKFWKIGRFGAGGLLQSLVAMVGLESGFFLGDLVTGEDSQALMKNVRKESQMKFETAGSQAILAKRLGVNLPSLRESSLSERGAILRKAIRNEISVKADINVSGMSEEASFRKVGDVVKEAMQNGFKETTLVGE